MEEGRKDNPLQKPILDPICRSLSLYQADGIKYTCLEVLGNTIWNRFGKDRFSTKRERRNKQLFQKERITELGGIVVVRGLVGMYYSYGLKISILLSPLGYALIMPLLVIVPTITYQLTCRGIKNRVEILFLWIGLWLVVNYLSAFLVDFLLYDICA